MKQILQKLCLVITLGLTLMSCDEFQKGAPGTFAAGDKKFLLNGDSFLIKAAEIHYTRIPADYWEHRIQMCKALGMNTICIYGFWNIHEQKPGEFDFEGQNDIRRFCELAQKNGMYIMLRPGPYVCSEWEMGGLPWWLLKKKDIKLRSNDPYFVERVRLFMNEMGKQLADMQITQGGNIIMVQVENEFSAYGEDKEYIANVRDIVKGAGFNEVPLFQCDWSSTFKRNALDDLLWTINFGSGANIDHQFAELKKARPNTPLMCSEFWSGWFDNWGRKHETRDAQVMVNGLKDMIDRNISFSLYMTHGGSTFGHWGGANSPSYSSMCSSYDYDAPISEAGWATDKYYKVRELLAKHMPEGEVLPDVPSAFPLIEIPAIQFEGVAPLFQNLPKPVLTDSIQSMESFDQGFGSILYRTVLEEVNEPAVLTITDVHDWAQVFINEKLIGTIDRRKNQKTVALPFIKKGDQLDILVESMGRVNFGIAIHDRKGITEKVEIVTDKAKQTLLGWNVFSLPTDAPFVQAKQYTKMEKTALPSYYKATFNLDKTGDVFLDMQTWGKGMVWVNGIALGRFWEIGPQQTLFMPGCWLKKGANEIIIFDLKGPTNAVVTGIKEPIIDLLRPEESLKYRNSEKALKLSSDVSPVIHSSLKPGNGWQVVEFNEKNKIGQFFRLDMLSGQKKNESAAIAEFYLIDENGKDLSREDWQVVYANSEEVEKENCAANRIFDLQESTYWSSAFNKSASYPFTIILDLGKEESISGFRYLPRAESGFPGMIKEFKAVVF